MNKEIDIDELLDFIIGHTGINCETNYDNESADNLNTLQYCLNYLLTKLYDNAKWSGDYRHSANWIAEKSITIAKDANEIIQEILEYEKGE